MFKKIPISANPLAMPGSGHSNARSAATGFSMP